MNAKTIKGVFFFLLVPLCFVWSIDTIRCYSGVYTSNTNAYFSNTEYTTSFGTAYAAKLGTLVITVDHSKGKNAGDNEDYSTYIHSLYFRNSTESNSISLNSDSYTFTADLCAVLTTRVNPTTYAPVDIAEQTLVTVQGSNETVLNILPEEFLTGNGIVSPTENGEVLQVDFYLKRTGTTPSDNDLTGHVHGAVSAPQVLYGDRYRLVVVSYGQIGEKIIIPNPHRIENRDGDGRRFEHRKHHLEECAHRSRSVDHGGFFQSNRNALDETAEHAMG